MKPTTVRVWLVSPCSALPFLVSGSIRRVFNFACCVCEVHLEKWCGFMGWFCLDSSRRSFLRGRLVFLQYASTCYGARVRTSSRKGAAVPTVRRRVHSSSMALLGIILYSTCGLWIDTVSNFYL